MRKRAAVLLALARRKSGDLARFEEAYRDMRE
jgi:hypothetical protein